MIELVSALESQVGPIHAMELAERMIFFWFWACGENRENEARERTQATLFFFFFVTRPSFHEVGQCDWYMR